MNPQFAISYNLQFEDEPTYMKVKVKYQAGDPGWGQEKTHKFFFLKKKNKKYKSGDPAGGQEETHPLGLGKRQRFVKEKNSNNKK